MQSVDEEERSETEEKQEEYGAQHVGVLQVVLASTDGIDARLASTDGINAVRAALTERVAAG